MADSNQANDSGECDCPPELDPRISRYFDRRNQRRRSGADRYVMGNVTRRLIDRLIELGPRGNTVFEGGCGPAAVLVELLRAGAASATGIDLSVEAVGYARERANGAGVGERATFRVGDAAATRIQVHDWVVMDKVICCYPDMDRLLANTVPAAGKVFAFAVPVSYGWRGFLTRTVLGMEQLVTKLSRGRCPGYVHDIARIEGRLRDAGFVPVRREALGVWHIGVFTRATGPAGAAG